MQGCALTAPGRLRRLTFGLGRPKIYSWSPGRATCWCWFLVLQSISKKKMLFNRVRVDIQRSFHVKSLVLLEYNKNDHAFRFVALAPWPGLLEAWLALTSVKYHGNLSVLIPLNQRLALTGLRATGPWSIIQQDHGE